MQVSRAQDWGIERGLEGVGERGWKGVGAERAAERGASFPPSLFSFALIILTSSFCISLVLKAKPMNGSSAPTCTGSGTDVETVHSLLHSLHSLVSNPEKIKSKEPPPQDPQHHVDDLNNFENYSKGTFKVEEDEDLAEEKRRLKEMEEFAADVANRSTILRDGILALLRGSASANADPPSAALLKDQIARLESDLKATESKLEEMANARNEAAASERRVRRGLYRLAGKRMTVEDVLKAVEEEDNGASFTETLAMIDGMNNKNAVSSPDGTAAAVVSSSDGAMSRPAFSAGATAGSKEPNAANAEEVAQLKKSLQDTQVIAETRDKKIAEVSAPNCLLSDMFCFWFSRQINPLYCSF